ncbi:MAG: RidA family protein [Rhodobiaceae bacterium]|nr:RidA family protein [Rhodobiaceae bacterium]
MSTQASNTVEERLAEIGIILPDAGGVAGNYAPYTISQNQVFISGQVPVTSGGLQFQGKLGAEFSIEEGQAAAQLCAINIIAQLKAACDGDLSRVKACVKLGGFVNCTPDFGDHPAVINGASDLMVAAFNEKGRHARFAVGATSLPFNVAVEVDAIFEID